MTAFWLNSLNVVYCSARTLKDKGLWYSAETRLVLVFNKLPTMSCRDLWQCAFPQGLRCCTDLLHWLSMNLPLICRFSFFLCSLTIKQFMLGWINSFECRNFCNWLRKWNILLQRALNRSMSCKQNVVLFANNIRYLLLQGYISAFSD